MHSHQVINMLWQPLALPHAEATITMDCQQSRRKIGSAPRWPAPPASVLLLMMCLLSNSPNTTSCALQTSSSIFSHQRRCMPRARIRDNYGINRPWDRCLNDAHQSNNRIRRWTNNHDRLFKFKFKTQLHLSSSNNNNNNLDGDPEADDDSWKPENSNQQKQPNGKNNNNTEDDEENKKPNILFEMINPFNAGKSLRSTVENAIDLASAITNDPASRLSPERRAIYYNYYVDDRLGLSSAELKDSTSTRATSSSMIAGDTTNNDDDDDEDYRPEVLVVGAAGALGRILVKRLLLENKVRVRVLVRDLYSSTLSALGTGVTYCQGDLNDMESLEYAVTDVDKIVFCAGGKRNNDDLGGSSSSSNSWDNLEYMLDQRSMKAQQIDGAGLRNLIHAYQNVRYADYGTSQALKRVLFKFRKRPADFDLFAIDDGSVLDGNTNNSGDGLDATPSDVDESSYVSKSTSSVAATLTQCDWKTNKFGHGVFVGKVGRYGEAALASARLRSRSDPDQGIDLWQGGFAGLVCRVCSDGGVYEAFVRTEAYERLGVEYVCEFKTASKALSDDGSDNTSRNKWITVRLQFTDFRPRMRQFQVREDENAQRRMRQALSKTDIPRFKGRDIRQLGFRYRGKNNQFTTSSSYYGYGSSSWSKFYLAFDYIKVYRGQPEPEFVYLSDARIPPVVNDAMVKHDLHRLVTTALSSSESGNSYSILNEEEVEMVNSNNMDRSAEETYFKLMGEEMIKQSGLR